MQIQTTRDLSKKLIELKSKRDTFREQQIKLIEKEQQLKQRYECALKARALIQEVSRQTQSHVENQISKLVTMALNAVYVNPPDFVVRFVSRRNQTECDLLFSENNKEQRPLESGGFGLCDLVSFALRIAFWCMNKTRPTIILDEPFRNLSPDLHERAGQMLKMISEKLGLQFIVVSHSETINEAADTTFLVEKNSNSIATIKSI